MMADLHLVSLTLREKLGNFFDKDEKSENRILYKDGCSLGDLAHWLYKVFCSRRLGVLKPHTIYPRQRGAVAVVWLEATFPHFNFFSTWTFSFFLMDSYHTSVVWMWWVRAESAKWSRLQVHRLTASVSWCFISFFSLFSHVFFNKSSNKWKCLVRFYMTKADGCFLRDLWTAACLPLVIGENDTTYESQTQS